MNPFQINRRQFMGSMGIATLALSTQSYAAVKKLKKSYKLGLIADLHNDIMHDGEKRMTEFLNEMNQAKPDALVQLGDFAYPNKDKNGNVIELFNAAHKNALHVIGNHDTDSGHTKEQCQQIWGMPGRYYTYELDGLNFIVLDGNDKGSPKYKGGYPSYVGAEQVEWLKQQVEKIDGPIVVMSHQPLAGPSAVDNSEEIQKILGEASDKVILAINGHTHIDELVTISDIPYLHINSASYYWMGGDYIHESYSSEIHVSHPWISYTCPYKDSLFATLTIDPESHTIQISGRASQWVGDSPEKLGKKLKPELHHNIEVAPRISNKNLTIKKS